MYSFEIVYPETIDDAVAALADEESEILAGGHTLIPTLKNRLANPTNLVSLRAIEGLKGVSVDGNAIVVRAATCHADVASATASTFPALSALAGNIGDPAVRNHGTVGGSLANNDPSACYPAAALGTGATIVTSSREISADDFFTGMFETALPFDEIITEVRFPVPESASYQKFEQPASRFALVGAFVARFVDGVRVAITGASMHGAFRWSEAEAALSGSFQRSSLDGLSLDSEDMIGDLHGSKEYRAHLAKVMTGRAVDAAG